jgi:peptidoglycan/LPS O-acetylase OafA/YrhL
LSAAEPQIAPLTALRFFAAAWVVLYHYWPNLNAAATPDFAAKGYLGVELFFVLSGFVISYVYQGQVERGGFRYGAFLWARLARVYPLHLATLGAVLLMALGAAAAGVAVGAEVFDAAALPANLALVHAWGFAPTAAFNHPSWSISAEWFAYLTFPLFAAVALRLQARPRLAGRAGRGAGLCTLRQLRALGGLSADPGDHRLGRAANRSVLRTGVRRAPVVARRGPAGPPGGAGCGRRFPRRRARAGGAWRARRLADGELSGD